MRVQTQQSLTGASQHCICVHGSDAPFPVICLQSQPLEGRMLLFHLTVLIYPSLLPAVILQITI